MKSSPFVVCVTNDVAANFTANVLLAIGAKPAMFEEPSEASELVSYADAVLVNLGTVHSAQAEVMRAVVCESTVRKVPWVLDPVACHLLSYRRGLAKELIARTPTIVRGNHAEIDFLTGAIPLVRNSTILSTGATDRIFRPGDVSPTMVDGGVEMLQTVTATGCAQGAVCAAMLGRGLSAYDAALAASRLMKRAGEVAWPRAKTPGAFKVALVDALYELEQTRAVEVVND